MEIWFMKHMIGSTHAGLGIRSLVFWANRWCITHVAHSWWATWAIRSHCSLKKREWANRYFFFFFLEFQSNFFERIAHFLWAKGRMSDLLIKASDLLNHHERPEQIPHSCSFSMSDLSDSLTVAHLSCAIWANRSHLLIWSEWSEQMGESCVPLKQLL